VFIFYVEHEGKIYRVELKIEQDEELGLKEITPFYILTD
jgi:hypothetical protein